jgi:hypothetical protein
LSSEGEDETTNQQEVEEEEEDDENQTTERKSEAMAKLRGKGRVAADGYHL